MLFIGMILLFFILHGIAAKAGKKNICEWVTGLLCRKPYFRRKKYTEAAIRKKVKRSVYILFAGTVSGLLFWIFSLQGRVLNGDKLQRNAAGEGSYSITLHAKSEDGQTASVPVTVEENAYSDEELDAFFAAFSTELSQVLLGENTSFREIKRDLHFAESIKGYPFTVGYSFDKWGVLGEGGENLLSEKDGIEELTVTATVRYRDYEKEILFPMRVFPGEGRGNFDESVRAAVEEAGKEGGAYVVLPQIVEGRAVFWEEKKENTGYILFFLSIVLAAGLCIGESREEQKKGREKIRSMEEEYGSVIAKLTLYLCAGQSIGKAWEAVAKTGKQNPVYGEMLYTCREIESGLPRDQAYQKFSVRVASKRYARLTTLLIQGQSKGNLFLLSRLREEVKICQEELRADKKRKGEEAGTKLLFPMTLMMGMIMILIMFPAFMKI